MGLTPTVAPARVWSVLSATSTLCVAAITWDVLQPGSNAAEPIARAGARCAPLSSIPLGGRETVEAGCCNDIGVVSMSKRKELSSGAA
jgi:hypothetical protein